MDYRTPSHAFRSATTVKNIRRVYSEHITDSKAKGRDGLRGSDLEDNIDELATAMSQKLRSGDYRFTQYREQLISRGSSRPPRVISVPTARDRLALRVLSEFLGEVFPDAQGKIPQIHVSRLLEVLGTGQLDTAVRIDLQEFYPSIDHSALHDGLRQRIHKKEVLRVIDRAVRTPTAADGRKSRERRSEGVPQGLAISNILSELVARDAEEPIRTANNGRYFRFVDDVLILCSREESENILQEAMNSLRKSGLRPHDVDRSRGKTYIADLESGFEFLGYSFSDQSVGVRDKSVHRLEKSLARAFTGFSRDCNERSRQIATQRWLGRINLLITGCVWQHNHRGWVQYFRQLDNTRILYELDATVSNLARRFDFPSTVTFKRFVRTYWTIRYPNDETDRYVPNFDRYSFAQKRVFLYDYEGREIVDEMNDAEVATLFSRTVNGLIVDLEKDIELAY